MRIVLISPYPLEAVNGVSVVVRNLHHGLRRAGHHSVVLCASDGGGPESESVLDGVHRFASDGSGRQFARSVVRFLNAQREPFDIIHLHTPYVVGVAVSRWGRRHGVPVVFTLHGRFLGLSPVRRLLLAFRLCQVVRNATSLTTVDMSAAEYHHVSPVLLIENGVDHHTFRPSQEQSKEVREHIGLPSSVPLVLFAGRWTVQKGLHALIAVLGRILDGDGPPFHLVVAGQGNASEVRTTVRQAGLEEHVIVIGRVPDPLPYYQAADVFVLFSDEREGLPMAILESAACNTAIIAANVAGIGRLLEDGRSALLVAPRNLPQLENGLRRLLSDKELRDRLGEAARHEVLERFTLDRMVDEYCRLYSSVMKRDNL